MGSFHAGLLNAGDSTGGCWLQPLGLLRISELRLVLHSDVCQSPLRFAPGARVMNPADKNRRSSVRKQPRGWLKIECRKRGTLGPSIAEVVWDLSQTGLCLVTNVEVKSGEELELHITSSPSHLRAQLGIGYVPQGRGIFPYLTVYENLLMGFEAASDKRVDLGRVDEMYAIFPVIKTMRNRVAGTLSGGQQQQLAIARALVRKPKLLLLDEPTEGIQPSIMHEIEDVIFNLRNAGDMAILLVEQFIDFALAVANHYYVIQTGHIVASGPVQEFNQETVKEYLAF